MRHCCLRVNRSPKFDSLTAGLLSSFVSLANRHREKQLNPLWLAANRWPLDSAGGSRGGGSIMQDWPPSLNLAAFLIKLLLKLLSLNQSTQVSFPYRVTRANHLTQVSGIVIYLHRYLQVLVVCLIGPRVVNEWWDVNVRVSQLMLVRSSKQKRKILIKSQKFFTCHP